MASTCRTKAARDWHAARNKFQQLKIDYELMGKTTPPEVIEETANAIDMA